jgi:glycosyltransferase involved in cell wall biosynthesis
MSSISEGSPFTILESFAVGIPVVATNVGGCRELIIGKTSEDQSKGMAGRIVNIADADAMANAALELLNNESAWVKAQQIGLERVRKYYSMEQLIANYSMIYKDAISTWQG